MKKKSSILFSTTVALCFFLVTSAQAADVILRWDHVNWAAYNSDLPQSGYKIWVGDGVQTPSIVGQVGANTNTFTHENAPFGSVCYHVSAFNQYGESDLSDPACATVGVPAAPDGTTITITVNITVGQ